MEPYKNGMDLLQGGILTGEKIKINKTKSEAYSPVQNEDLNFPANGNTNSTSKEEKGLLKRRHSTNLFPPRHSGK